MNKMCIECGLVKEMPVDFDVDNHNATGYTAKCKECRGTLPVKPKKKRKHNKTRRPRRSTKLIEEPVEVPDIAPEEVESTDIPVVVSEDMIENDD